MELSFEIWPNAPYEGMDIVGVALNSWGDKSVEWCMERSAKHGYKAVDFIFDKFLELDEKEYAATVERVPALAKKLKMKIASIGAHHLSITNKKWRVAGAMQMMKKSIDLASAIGAPTVATYIAGYYNPPTYILMTPKEAKDLFVKMIKELADYAEDKGVTLSIEPHEGTIINTPEVTLELMERINSKNVFITIDFGGIEVGMKAHKTVEELIGQFKGLVNHVHAKDVTGAPGNWNMCWFGGGQVNFQRYADALRKINYKGYICVEWEGWFKGGLAGVGETYGQGLADFDRAAPEAREFLSRYFS
ncbi:MAG: hypothetical protein C0404_13410 [Verrucomicrobia bacterium]|nr:hypothetical protein [Verrucomicrobiota bacterium]